MKEHRLKPASEAHKIGVGERATFVLNRNRRVNVVRFDALPSSPLLYFVPVNPSQVPVRMRRGRGKLFAVVDTTDNYSLFYRRQEGADVVRDLNSGRLEGYFSK
jgi:hypothetical protein